MFSALTPASARRARAAVTVVAAAGAVAGSFGFAATTPTATASTTHYIVIGGTCDVTSNGLANQLPVANKIAVAYPAAAPGDGACPNTWGTSYNDSVNIGHVNAKSALENAYRADPGGHFVVVGYSQGAQVANMVLNDVADGRSIPAGQVSAKLFGDPQTPGTGIEAVVPKGVGAPFGGYVSSGPGRTNFGAINFVRYCITDDGVCDDRNPLTAIGGYFAQHGCYGVGKIFARVGNGIYTNRTEYFPKQDCHSPLPF